MKQPKLTLAILSLTLALAPFAHLHAEMVSEEVQEDSITPERSSALESEVVILKKKQPARPVAQKRVIVREESLPEESAYEPVAVQPAAAPAPKTVGSSLDQGIQTKMDDVKTQFENALLRTLDRIKISVDDGAAPAAATTTTIVNDSVVNAQAAPAKESYIALSDAPSLNEDGQDVGPVVKAKVAEEAVEEVRESRFRVSPVIGWTSIGSDFYNIDSQYTAGIQLEMEVTDNISAYAGFAYSEYEVGMAMANPMMMAQPGIGYGGYMNTLQYNQNVFDAGMRLYLLPRKSAFNAFIGGGLGFNKGYLNYAQQGSMYQNPNMNVRDYVVTSFLGLLETGAEVKVSRSIALGVNLKYATVLSAKENQPLYNTAFINGGYNGAITPEQMQVGGSIANESFYSILGTVKVGF